MTPEEINSLFAVGGAAGGAVLSTVGTWLVHRATKEKKAITIFRSPLATMLAVTDMIRSEVVITYKNQPVDSLHAGELVIQNSGTLTIRNIRVMVRSPDGSQIIDLTVSSTSFSAATDAITVKKMESSYDIEIDFLNRGDRVVFAYQLIGNEAKPIVDAHQEEVSIRVRDEMTSWIPDVIAESVFQGFDRLDPFTRWLLSQTLLPYGLYRKAKQDRDG